MKKLLMLAAATAAILPMTAQADATAYGKVNLEAKASNTCAVRGISGAETYSGGTVSGDKNPASVSLSLGSDVIDPTTAFTNSATKTLTLSAFCNYGDHHLSLHSKNGGLTNPASTPFSGVFHRRIEYKATLSGWGPTDASVEADGDLTSGASSAGGVSFGDSEKSTKVTAATATTTAKLSITTKANSTAPLLAGLYSDVLTVKMGAAFPTPPAS
jgi:hypothetical protein